MKEEGVFKKNKRSGRKEITMRCEEGISKKSEFENE
jgi:hypothetical protein